MSGTTKNTIGAAEEMRTILARGINELCSFSANAAVTNDRRLSDRRAAARRLSYTIDYFRPFVDYTYLAAAHRTVEEMVNDLGTILDEAAFIKWLEKSQPKIPTALIPGVGSLIKERRLGLIDLRNASTGKLSEDFFDELRREFKAAVTPALRVLPGNVSFQEISRAVIRASHEEMKAANTALYRPSKTRTSHRFRISVRRLRYALDLFAPYVLPELSFLASELVLLQACLGKLRNCDLKLNALGDWLTVNHDGVINRDYMTLQWHAAIWLLGDLFERRPKYYRKALGAGEDLLASGFALRLTRVVSSALSQMYVDTRIPVHPSAVQSTKELQP